MATTLWLPQTVTSPFPSRYCAPWCRLVVVASPLPPPTSPQAAAAKSGLQRPITTPDSYSDLHRPCITRTQPPPRAPGIVDPDIQAPLTVSCRFMATHAQEIVLQEGIPPSRLTEQALLTSILQQKWGRGDEDTAARVSCIPLRLHPKNQLLWDQKCEISPFI